MPVDRKLLIRAGITLGAISLISGGVLAGRAVLGEREQPGKPTPSPSGPAGLKDYQNFIDQAAGVAIAYPRQWQRFEHPDGRAKVPLLAGPGENDFLLIRECKLPVEVPAEGVSGLKEGFDAIINRTTPNVLASKQIVVNNLAGWHYLYTFYDAKLKAEGANSHYFLVDKDVVVQMVFQVIPREEFDKFAKTFDQVAVTFRTIKPRTGVLFPCSEQSPEPSPPPSP
ncbi:MAG: hypothetical protein ACRDIU_01345 [Actinomycetota bacterium]